MKFTIHHSGSSGNLYTLQSGNATLLIEAGVPVAKVLEAIDYDISDIVGCLVSHMHLDHCKAVPELLKRGIDCYMSMETADKLKVSGHRLHKIFESMPFEVGDFWVYPFKTHHDVKGSMGFFIQSRADKESLLFVTDSFYIEPIFKMIDYIAVECNYSKETLLEGTNPVVKKRLLRSHMNLGNCKKLIQANMSPNLKAVYLLHLSRLNADDKLFIDEVQKICGCPVYTK